MRSAAVKESKADRWGTEFEGCGVVRKGSRGLPGYYMVREGLH